MDFDPPPPSKPTTHFVKGRGKPKAKHITERLTDFIRFHEREAYGSLSSSEEMDLVDTVDVPGDLIVTFLDIGQGNCTFIECPGGETILVDCGSVTSGEPRKEIVAGAREFILARLIDKKLDYLIISHPDKDHINAVYEVLDGVTVGKALLGGDKGGYGGSGKSDFAPYVEKATKSDLASLMINGGKFYCEPPDSDPSKRLIQCKQKMDVFVVCANAHKLGIGAQQIRTDLAPSGVGSIKTGTKANMSCIVLCLRYAKRQMLICGDATFATEWVMLDGPWKGELRSDVLEGGHHGSADSFSDGFLKAVDPCWLHFSADNRGTFRHPTWEVVQRVIGCCPRVVNSTDFGPHGVVIGPKMSVGLDYESKKLPFLTRQPRSKEVLEKMSEFKVDGRTVIRALIPKWFELSDPLGEKREPTFHMPEWVQEVIKHCTLANSVDLPIVDYWGKTFDELAVEISRLTTEKSEIDDFKYYWDWEIIEFNLFTTLTTANLGVYWVVTVDPEGNMTTDLA